MISSSDNYPKNCPIISVYKKSEDGKRLKYNRGMQTYKFYVPIQVRYGDLDPQWHVNNSRYLTYMEQARLAYVMELCLFDGKSFMDLRLIIADVHISYRAPIALGQNIRVGTRTEKIGNKSIVFSYQIEDQDSHQVLAAGEVVGVAYNYREQKTMRVPDEWRIAISEYEGRNFD